MTDRIYYEFQEHQRHVSELMVPEAKSIEYLTLGLSGEAGEVANVVKKAIRNDGGEITNDTRLKLMDEIGDVLWYLTALSEQLHLHLDILAMNNISKLRLRKEEEDGLYHV